MEFDDITPFDDTGYYDEDTEEEEEESPPPKPYFSDNEHDVSDDNRDAKNITYANYDTVYRKLMAYLSNANEPNDDGKYLEESISFLLRVLPWLDEIRDVSRSDAEFMIQFNRLRAELAPAIFLPEIMYNVRNWILLEMQGARRLSADFITKEYLEFARIVSWGSFVYTVNDILDIFNSPIAYRLFVEKMWNDTIGLLEKSDPDEYSFKKTSFEPQVPTYDETMRISPERRAMAVSRFLQVVIPGYNEIRNSQYNKKLVEAGKHFALGHTTIDSVMNELFKQLLRIQVDDTYLMRLWNQRQSEALEDVAAYMKRVPESRNAVYKALFGSKIAFARHIQWAYDTYLVSAGFKPRTFFSGLRDDRPFHRTLEPGRYRESYRGSDTTHGDFDPDVEPPIRRGQHGFLMNSVSTLGTGITPISACHGCGAKGAGITCGKCGKGAYCSIECQKSDWIQGKHTLDCWNSKSQDYDELSREIIMDLNTRTPDAGFPEALGEPLNPIHKDTAIPILQGLANRVPVSLVAAHEWLSSVRVTHATALLSHPSTQDADAVDHLEEMVHDNSMHMPPHLSKVLNAFDVHGKLTEEQRDEMIRFITQHASSARSQLVGNAFTDWVATRGTQFKGWRTSRKEKIAAQKAYIRDLETLLARARKALSKMSLNPFKRRKNRKRSKKAWRRAGP